MRHSTRWLRLCAEAERPTGQRPQAIGVEMRSLLKRVLFISFATTLALSLPLEVLAKGGGGHRGGGSHGGGSHRGVTHGGGSHASGTHGSRGGASYGGRSSTGIASSPASRTSTGTRTVTGTRTNRGSAASNAGETSVRGYTKKDGTYVAPHQRTTPDNTKGNNWSTKGNVNPHTGKPGTKEPN